MGHASAGAAGASPRTVRVWDRGEVIGAAVLAFAGGAWFGWAQDDPPRSWVPYLAAGSVVSVLCWVALVGLVVRRRTTTGSGMADPRVRRGYWMTVAVEVALIVGGNLLLAAVGHPDYDAAWTLFVVGVHFVPLARIFHARALALTGAVVAVVAVGAAVLGLASDVAPSAVAGAGGGVVFIGYVAWVLGHGPTVRPER
jgi:hypothetical protein